MLYSLSGIEYCAVVCVTLNLIEVGYIFYLLLFCHICVGQESMDFFSVNVVALKALRWISKKNAANLKRKTNTQT